MKTIPEASRAAYEETQANEAAALERARTAPAIVPNVHVMATSGEPTGAHYNETQMNGDIRDGDVLIIGETVAILDRAWPVAIVGPCGAFHAIGDGAGDDVCDADRARSGRAPLAPIIARIRAGEFAPTAQDFDQCIERAFRSAQDAAAPFVPSPAQVEKALAPVVDRIVRMPEPARGDYVRATFCHWRPGHSTAARMIRDAIGALRGVTQAKRD